MGAHPGKPARARESSQGADGERDTHGRLHTSSGNTEFISNRRLRYTHDVDWWRGKLVSDDEGLRRILGTSRRIAVLGIKPETHADRPAFYVPKYMSQNGYEIIPVPVYYPDVREILGRPVYRKLTEIAGPVDMVNVFRKPKDVAGHLDDLLAARPKTVWMQLGISNDEVAEALAKAGIEVVQDRCLLVEHRRLIGRPRT